MAEVVLYSPALVKSLEKSLQSAFNQPYLILNRQPRKPGSGFHVSLANGDVTAQDDDGSSHMVMEILTASDAPTTFYFGFVAAFRQRLLTEYILGHASLTIVREIYGELVPLCRAEWDYDAASDAVSNHAQPHWHFVQSPERIGGIVRTLISPPGDFAAGTPSELFSDLADCGKVHFAMVSFWDRDKKHIPSQKQVFDAEEFPQWFDGLTRYIAGQIAYLLTRMPSRDFAPTR